MFSTLGLAFDLGDRSDRLDPRIWKAIATRLLGRSGEGLVVADAALEIVFTTPLGHHILDRLEPAPRGRLPERLATVVEEQLAANDAMRIDRVAARQGCPIQVFAVPLAGAAPAHVAVFLRDEPLRDDALYGQLKEQFGVSQRGFQLALLVKKGLSNREIAAQLRLRESTVKIYLHHLYRACGVPSRTALVALLERLRR